MALSLAYEEPSAPSMLILVSFFLLLNIIEWSLDRFIYCGLLGQILLGTAWGTPGAKLLSPAFEGAVMQLGYVGLLLLIFEGGLSSSLSQLHRNVVLSVGVALTGILLPLGLSFLLAPLVDATPLQCFAAGAALSSTSLGTTLTVLRASGLTKTRLGTVLSSAALIDDVVGLVMVQLVQGLGNSTSTSSILIAILRPTGVSVGLVILSYLLCRFVATPLRKTLHDRVEGKTSTLLQYAGRTQGAFVVQVVLLIAMIVVASYAGGSNLLAAYLAGAIVSWWFDTGFEGKSKKHSKAQIQEPPSQMVLTKDTPVDASDIVVSAAARSSSSRLREPQIKEQGAEQKKTEEDRIAVPESERTSATSGVAFDTYLGDTLKRVLKPCFFASIGFAIPVRVMFSGDILWRGLVYAMLMALGKLATGFWLLRISTCLHFREKYKQVSSWLRQVHKKISKDNASCDRVKEGAEEQVSGTTASPCGPEPAADSSSPSAHEDSGAPPSLYPGLLLGLAMVPRGEVGFLIAALAQANSLLGNGEDAPLFLIVNWAIFLCTAIGPLAVGLLARHIKALEAKRSAANAAPSPLGVWGVDGGHESGPSQGR